VEVIVRAIGRPGDILPDDPMLAERHKPPLVLKDWYLGLDLGQLSDPTAAALVERTIYPRTRQPSRFDVTLLRRFEPGTLYPAIVREVSELLLKPGADGALHFPGMKVVADATGVGKPVVDMLREAMGYGRVVAITITGGSGHSFDASSASYHVGKVELVGALQALQGQERFRIAANVREAKEVAKELGTFSSKLTPTGQLTYESWRTTDKDDLVLSIALPLWYGRWAPCSGVSMLDPQLVPGQGDLFAPNGEGGWITM
jgi:hypothetical protein